jgi:hypothetical protein
LSLSRTSRRDTGRSRQSRVCKGNLTAFVRTDPEATAKEPGGVLEWVSGGRLRIRASKHVQDARSQRRLRRGLLEVGDGSLLVEHGPDTVDGQHAARVFLHAAPRQDSTCISSMSERRYSL